jgi:ATP-dependent Clp protease ATP-binding subunit ClpB
MALNPKQWTTKVQEAFAAAFDQARRNDNPELTPDHLLVALRLDRSEARPGGGRR